jgi:DNA-binding CsgD family transcriptional regulator
MQARDALIPIRATEELVDALNQAVELETDAEGRIEFLLQRLQALLGRECRCALWLIEDLLRDPAPLVRRRIVARPAYDTTPMGDMSEAQRALDESAPLSQPMIRGVLANIRTPVTVIASETWPADWFESVLVARHLSLIGCCDCIASMWAATDARAVFVVVHRRESDKPFGAKDKALVSLVLRAVAPLVDRNMFHRAVAAHLEQMSPREREILLMLLSGDSEKQIAAQLSRSINTVHTFVRQIYRRFNVSSRGELMAQFVDKAVVESLRQNV